MNLQTEALAKQAAEYAIEFATQDQALYIPKLMEKFAELIVRECMDLVASRPYIDDGNWSHPSMMIKQHFGVEE